MKYIFLSAPCWRWYRSERHWPGWWKRWTIVTILEGVSVCMCVHVFIWEWMNKRENLLFFGCILYLSYFIPHGECWWDSIWIRGHKMTLLTVIYVRFLTFQCINVYIVTTSTFVFFKLKIQVTRGRRIIWLCYMISVIWCWWPEECSLVDAIFVIDGVNALWQFIYHLWMLKIY